MSTNSLSRAQLNYDNGVVKSVHYGDILVNYNTVLDVKTDIIPFITEGEIDKYKSNLLKNRDLVFADAAEDMSVGKAIEINNITTENIVAGLHTIVARARIQKADYFLGYYINSDNYHRQLLRLVQGTKVSSISKGSLKETKVSMPEILEEQEKIGNFFKILDKTIALHHDAIQRQQALKKGLLQQLFPVKGQVIPKIRFTGFNEEWEQRKLGDYLTIPINKKANIKSTTDLMTLSLNLGGINLGSNRETLSLGSTTYYERKSGQFIYGKQNFFNGSMAIVPEELDGKATSGDVPSLDIRNINSDFLFVYVSRIDYWKQKKGMASGTGSKRIHESTIQGFEILVPLDKEQEKNAIFSQVQTPV